MVDALEKLPTIPCTDCKYCVENCPQKINIPGVFNSYNQYIVYDNFTGAKRHYDWVINNKGKASDYIVCGSCEGHCSQHIQIIDTLKEVTGVFE